MKLVTPITPEKKHQLEQELLSEERRLINSSRLALQALKTQFNPLKWIKTHPVETALLALTAGLYIGKSISSNKKYPSPIELA